MKMSSQHLIRVGNFLSEIYLAIVIDGSSQTEKFYPYNDYAISVWHRFNLLDLTMVEHTNCQLNPLNICQDFVPFRGRPL